MVTGAGRNIGRACVLELASAGFNVVINGSKDRAACEAVGEAVYDIGEVLTGPDPAAEAWVEFA